MDFLFLLIISMPVLILIFACAVFFLCTRFKSCPADKVIIVYNTRTGYKKYIHGRRVFIKPFVEDYSILSLKPMKAKVEVHSATTKEINEVSLKATVTFAFSTEIKYLQRAAEYFLSLLSPENIEAMVGEIIEGQLRLAIAKYTAAEIIENEFVFIEEVKEAVNEEIGKLGLHTIYVQLKDAVAKENK